MPLTAERFEQSITRTVRLDYLLSLPTGYGDEAERHWPLSLFLHGAGERGDDIDRVRTTIYPDAAHDSWTETYDNPELYTWFLSHTTRGGPASHS